MKELIYVIHRTARHTRRARGQAALPASSIPAVARIIAGPQRLRTDTVEFPRLVLTAAVAR